MGLIAVMMAGSAGPGLQLQGERRSGQDVRTQNITAVAAIANIVKSSLGPVGLDKVCCPVLCTTLAFQIVLARMKRPETLGSCCLQMLVDDIGDVTITNDGATILKLLEVEHPAAKVCVSALDINSTGYHGPDNISWYPSNISKQVSCPLAATNRQGSDSHPVIM